METENVLIEAEAMITPSFASAVFSRQVPRSSQASNLTGTINRLKSIVGLTSTAPVPQTRHADINIFTVASGLLYEVGEVDGTILRLADDCSASHRS